MAATMKSVAFKANLRAPGARSSIKVRQLYQYCNALMQLKRLQLCKVVGFLSLQRASKTAPFWAS